VRGEGDVFCSGADFAAVSGAGGVEFVPAFERMLESLARFRLPTVAAITGAALGGGFQLACVCDFRVAANEAKIGIPSARLGIMVNFENIQRLVLLAGIARAKEVLMTGRTYSGAEAAEAGLVTKAVPSEDVLSDAHSMATELSLRAPLSVQGAKRAIQTVADHLSGARRGTPDATAEIDRLVTEAYNSRDLREGIAAMSEKRDPNFEGI
jgi:enoyl-CoA hydratase/carnithine racemase